MTLADRIQRHRIVLLGEVHDNAMGHAARSAALTQAVSAGWRPVLVMEQFDRDRQSDLDAALRRCSDAQCVIDSASGAKAGWQWDFYRPVIELALREGLPIRAGNLSRAHASGVVRQGLTALDAATLRAARLDRPIPGSLLAAQAREVEASHCGMLPARLVPGMATAQAARDAVMAQVINDALIENPDRPVVLLAGNGHVRRDVGVSQWLGHRSSYTVAFLEPPLQAEPARPGHPHDLPPYDRVQTVAREARPDPCASMKPIK